MVKIVIPVDDEQGEILSAHFGRAAYYAWFLVENGEIKERGVNPNDSVHMGGQGLPPERMMAMGAEVVITTGMGMRAISLFQNSTVAVLQAQNLNSEQTIKDYAAGNLIELTEGCLHAVDHEH